MDDEAELGSDDEDNDDYRREIDKEDAEENEDGLDDDLDGFVVHGADDEEIGDPDSDAYRRHQEYLEMQDKLELQQCMDAVIFGNNKKRKRGEFESDLDDDSKRKLRMREERFMQLRQGIEDPDEDMIDLREIRRQKMKMQGMDEELSEEEIQKQVDNDELYQLKKTMQNHDLERYNSLKQKEEKDDEKL